MIKKFKIQNSKFKIILAAAIIVMFTVPTNASAAPTASVKIDQGYIFTANANGTNLSKIDIYRIRTAGPPNLWTLVGTTGCSGSTCNYSVTWDPTSSGTTDWYIVANAYDSTGQCTGSPFAYGPSWTDCGVNDYTGMNIASVSGPSSVTAGYTGTFTAALSGSAQSGQIWITKGNGLSTFSCPAGPGGVPYLASTGYYWCPVARQNNTTNLSGTYTFRELGTYTTVVNAFSSTDQTGSIPGNQCSGTPSAFGLNSSVWSDCGASDNISTTVNNNAQYVSQTCPPSNMTPGQTANVSVTMRNSGDTTWPASSVYRLGSQNPQDNTYWGVTRMPVNSLVQPGWSYTFYADITARSTPGTYNFQWRMVQEGVQWFGETTPNCSTTVAYPAPPTPSVSTSPTCTPANTDSMYTISWTNNPTYPVTWVDITDDVDINGNFRTWWNKSISDTSTTVSTAASSGFGGDGFWGKTGPLTLQPNTPYYVRTYNGYNNSGATPFTTPSRCPPPTASITGPLAALIDQSLTYSAQIFNAGSGTISVTRSDNNTFTCPPGIFTDSTGRNWCIIGTLTNGNFNGSTFSAAFTPRESGVYVVIVNAYANTTADFTSDKTTKCTGNPFGLNPTQQAQWSDCGPNDNITTNVDRTPAPPPTTNCGGGVSPRAEGLVTTRTLQTGSKFGTSTTGRCVVNDSTIEFKPFKIPTYDDLKSIYYTQSKATKTEITPPSGTANQGTLRSALNSYNAVLIKGDLGINAALGGAPKTAVVFVDGNLSIDTPTFTFGDANSGIIFVVGGNVIIDQSVTRIDAVIISAGKIYTAGAGCATNNVETTNALVVNGSLISLDPGAIVFCRTLTNNSQAAERIYQQPKYLVILRDLFADTLQKWSEIQ